MKTIYTQMSDDCTVKLERLFKTECCDCGLVHLWELKIIKNTAVFRIKRDNRATGQRRRSRRKGKR